MNIHRGEVCLTTLPPALRRQAWEFIKTNRPELKALLEGAAPLCNLPAVATAWVLWPLYVLALLHYRQHAPKRNPRPWL